MKVGDIAKPNSKGQIVIPKQLRDELGISQDVALHITKRGPGIYIQPIKEIIGTGEVLNDAAYADILKKTQGSWSDDTWMTTSTKQDEIEKKAAKKGKKAW